MTRCGTCHQHLVQSSDMTYFRGKVFCEECNAWSHGTCLQLTWEQLKHLKYYCPTCEARRSGSGSVSAAEIGRKATAAPRALAVKTAVRSLPSRNTALRSSCSKAAPAPKAAVNVSPVVKTGSAVQPTVAFTAISEAKTKAEHDRLIQEYAIGDISSSETDSSDEGN